MPNSTLVMLLKLKALKAQVSVVATGAAFVVLGTVSTAAPAMALTLWSNGDFNGVNGLGNEFNTLVSTASVYDDFIVPTGESWVIDTIFSNNLMSFTGVSQANWEIREGITAGNGGALVSGGNASATQAATGRSGFNLNEFRIQVSGLEVTLTPGRYWLSVAPIGSGSGRSYVTTTSGANAVGTPPGNNGNSFFNSSYFGENFTSRQADYSMGVAGTSTPVPFEFSPGLGILALGACGAISQLRSKMQKQKALKLESISKG